MSTPETAPKRAAQETNSLVKHVLAQTAQGSYGNVLQSNDREFRKSQPSLEAIRSAITNARRYNFLAR